PRARHARPRPRRSPPTTRSPRPSPRLFYMWQQGHFQIALLPIPSNGGVRRRGWARSSVTYSPARPVATVEASSPERTGLAFPMAKSSFKLKILYGEGDPEVLASQADSIQKAGHQVTSVLGRKGVEAA